MPLANFDPKNFLNKARQTISGIVGRVASLPQQIQATAQFLRPKIQQTAQYFSKPLTAPRGNTTPTLPSFLSPTNFNTPILGGVRRFSSQLGPSGAQQFTQGVKDLASNNLTPASLNVLNFGTSGLKNVSSKIVDKGFKYIPSLNLSAGEKQVETSFGNFLKNNFNQVIEAYKSRFGNVLNTDNFREFSKDYSVNKQTRSLLSRAVHEPASALTKKMYQQELAKPDPRGLNLVTFTAGGTGAGKTTAIEGLPAYRNAQIVYDTNMSNLSSATNKIEQALQAGKKVSILYIHSLPDRALNQVLSRAFRTGRTVPLNEHVDTHVGALDTIKKLAQKYANNPNVDIQVVDNTGEKGQQFLSSLENLPKTNYNKKELQSKLLGRLENEYKAGNLPKEIYQGTKGVQFQSLGENGGITGSTEFAPQNPSGPLTPSSPTTTDPVQKIISALKTAKPIRGQQETLYSQERAARFAKSAAVREQIGGERGAYAGIKQLGGELPKVQFESIRPQFTQQDLDSLFNQISNHPTLMEGQKTHAITGLAKLLGERGGGIPQKSEIALLEKIFGSDFTNAVLKNRGKWEKILEDAGAAINLPRAITASLDLSAPLRQGLPLITRREFWTSLGPMVKSLLSEKSFRGIQEEIASRPTHQLMQEAKLALTDINGLLPQEEAFLTNFAGKLPGIRASNRAYVGFLNKLRADTFDALAKDLQKQGRLNPDTAKSIASFVNTATGRGDLPKVLQQAAPLLNGLFFSPRLIASRLQLLNPQFYIKQDPLVRKEALKAILGATGAISIVLGLSKLAGAQVGTDPKNADFAKVKVGNTRYDLTGGFAAYFRLAAQLKSGKLISSTTGKVSTLGEGYKPLTRYDIILRFLQNKESPVVSLLSSMLQGKNPVGEPLNFKETNPFNNPIAKLFIPMLAQDIYDAYQEWGAEGIVRAIPSTFGIGTQTYGYNLPDKLKAETEGMSREERNAFRDKALQVAIAKGAGQEVSEKKKEVLEHFQSRMEGMDTETAKAFIQQIARKNRVLAKDLMTSYKQSVKEEKRGLTALDKEIKSLGISNGARAKYIDSQLKQLDPQQRRIFYLELKRKGLINTEVIQQLGKK